MYALRYLPILDELFSSDTTVIFAMGLVPAFFTCIKQSSRAGIKTALICFAVYALCEVLSDIHTNYMSELLLLFTGTAALGAAVGITAASLGKRTGRMVPKNKGGNKDE
ncbi:MAG: hypothetical protein J6M17_10060 [Ruminococcus sp.]|nr:hypothetical protein [Ruminococcus sp.]